MTDLVKQTELDELAEGHALSPALALGLGAGVYFEYFRRPQPSPTHWISGIHRCLRDTLTARTIHYKQSPQAALREALRENALWFNLDRAPTTALLGMEMLAEELAHYQAIADWRECLLGMSEEILANNALYRRMYVAFLNEATQHLSPLQSLISELDEVADAWNSFAAHLQQTAQASNPPELEHASRLLRRLAFREEHFWGTVLDSVSSA
ncbi:MAG TPA: DUF4872 domain-containing protein [Anaerolineae bacterium]|nr:DUF4872 domain-containing protein [Anaerolineae bacterium]